MGLFTPVSWDLGGGRADSGGCVAERARVPGRFVIATEAVVCRRWPVRALRTARRVTWAANTPSLAPAATVPPTARRWPSLTADAAGAVPRSAVSLSQWPRSRGPAIVARCKEAATVNPCVSGCVAYITTPHGDWRSPVTIFRKLTALASGIRNKNEWITKLPPGDAAVAF